MKSVPFVILSMLICACSPQNSFEQALLANSSGPRSSVIWNEDTREDISLFDTTGPQAQATALLVAKRRLYKTESGDFTFEARPLKKTFPICDNEKYVNQNVLGHCSGVLIGPRRVLTAGHCVPEEPSCEASYITFGRTQIKASNPTLKADEVYSCKRIIKLEYNSTRDYAIIELDRDVTQAHPVQIGHGDALKIGEPVLSLSYPLGLPLKKDTGTVLQNSAGGFYIKAMVDTFAGSSGSPLFNSQNELVGLLVTGTDDFDEEEFQRIKEEKSPGACINFKRCKDYSCMGERYLKVEGIEFPQ